MVSLATLNKYRDKENESPNTRPTYERFSSSKKSTDDKESSYGKPTPLDFDTFLPWVCLQWSCPLNVVVTRLSQEEYIKIENRISTLSRQKSLKSFKFKPDDCDIDSKNSTTFVNKTSLTKSTHTIASNTDTVPVRAYYDCRGYLVEIAIIGCHINIHRKVIQAMNVCLPFHTLLTRLTIRKGGLSYHLLYEIGKLLPHSNLTDICLDDTFIPEGNYYVLLEKKSPLKYLSLNRCAINDSACKESTMRIDFGLPASTLLTLELSSNLISDLGAHALGIMLRRNRKLLHINLSGNRISDTGVLDILRHLTEFPLTCDEILETKRKRAEFLKHRATVYKKCLEDVRNRQRQELQVATTSSLVSRSMISSKHGKTKKSKKNSVVVEHDSKEDSVEMMTKEIVGDFSDPYNNDNVVKKDGYCYSIGNMTLSSLNLAYNNFGLLSVKRIEDTLKYQSVVVKPAGATGLLKIVIDGNDIPDMCIEYETIAMFLKKAIAEHEPHIPIVSGHGKKSIAALRKV